jgi:hypothetical protein
MSSSRAGEKKIRRFRTAMVGACAVQHARSTSREYPANIKGKGHPDDKKHEILITYEKI